MAVVLEVIHTSTYRYGRAVRFGPHRLMFRPRASHDLQVLSASVEVSPAARISWMSDVHSNSVNVIEPLAPAARLSIDARLRVRHLGAQLPRAPLAEGARDWPLAYSAEDRRDLGALLEPHHPDPRGVLTDWIAPVAGHSIGTLAMLERLTASIHALSYETRATEGTQSPTETLERGAGSCRDFAWLLIESCRRLGLAARFVSGYLYDPALDGEDAQASPPLQGAGATHAWAEIYLPGAGWTAYDPTNPQAGRARLIRVAVAREPRFAAPLSGLWWGEAEDFLGLDVAVEVRRIEAPTAEA